MLTGVDQLIVPYKGYLRLGSIEMERARKLVERKNLSDRLFVIEERCRQLDAEKMLLLSMIQEQAELQGGNQAVVPMRKKIKKTDVTKHLSTSKYADLDRSLKKDTPETQTEEPGIESLVREDTNSNPDTVKPGAAGFKISYWYSMYDLLKNDIAIYLIDQTNSGTEQWITIYTHLLKVARNRILAR